MMARSFPKEVKLKMEPGKEFVIGRQASFNLTGKPGPVRLLV